MSAKLSHCIDERTRKMLWWEKCVSFTSCKRWEITEEGDGCRSLLGAIVRKHVQNMRGPGAVVAGEEHV